ncbi:MAG: immune inhibitor A [Chloroflexi bacterium]|nr:immune inhibitor A [Chloroflexota bacterium]MCI0576255.1 immune inhibitor A [Chloroflexota bacterium]MCI0644549.1 immune inhibitor A [Chloroflexota bacterium]MCI0728762.1 immune inhibitor A [Chloroflexota bacterium]
MRRCQAPRSYGLSLYGLLALMLAACALWRPPTRPIPTLITDPPPPAAFETLAALTSATVPPRDLADLTRRLKGLDPVPAVAGNTPAACRPDDRQLFWYKDRAVNENVQVEAVLVYCSAELNLWLESDEKVSEARLREAAAVVEQQILPTNRAFFGREWQPGIDGDNRLNILHLADIGGSVAGYFSQADEFVADVNPYSNQREVLYVSLKHAPLGSDAYYAVIAHEMQHLIHWYTDANEEPWLNEGLSELAIYLNGYESAGFMAAYAAQPDVQLNDFLYQGEASSAHYGAAFLLTAYFLDRFGEEASRALVRHPENGIASFEQLLADLQSGLTFDDLFADWLVASYLDGRGLGQGLYQYDDLDVPHLEGETRPGRSPAGQTAAVYQYGADFIRLRSGEPVTFVFTGTRQVSLLDASPHSGNYFWSSYPADNSDVTLTREFDLTSLARATLTFWTWYDLEEGWDYAYLAVSGDSGLNWQLLETASTTAVNPQGNSYGPGYTGVSGGGLSPAWTQETADLSLYAGRPILVRFEVITDEAVHYQGFVLDDIAVPELAYLDDAESSAEGWQAAGFVHHANVLPQRFTVQLLLLGDGAAPVERWQLDEDQTGRWTVPLSDEFQEAIIIISGNTPVTRQPAAYTYQVIN